MENFTQIKAFDNNQSFDHLIKHVDKNDETEEMKHENIYEDRKENTSGFNCKIAINNI